MADPDDDMWQYAMDDLSRERQEELPLDSHERRGRSYAPGRKNGTDHIPKKVKLALQNAWGNPIRDEESEQMEGLAMGDCPWRSGKEHQTQVTRRADPILPPSPGKRSRNDFLKSSVACTSRVPSERQDMVMKDNTTAISGLVTTQASAADQQHQLSNTTIQTATGQDPNAQIDSRNTAGNRQVAIKEAVDRFKEALSKCDMTVNPPTQQETAATWTFYWGYCMIHPNTKPENAFRARFEMRMKFPTLESGPQGTIHFASQDLPPREHSIDKLNHPLLENKYCIIATAGRIPETSYRLELKDEETTKLFADCLQGLQRSVAYQPPTVDQNGTSSSTPHATSEDQPRSSPDKVRTAVNQHSAFGDQHVAAAVGLASNHGSHMESLVHIDDNSNNTTDPKVNIPNASKNIVDLLDQIAEALAGVGTAPNSFNPVSLAIEKVLKAKYPRLEWEGRQGIKAGLEGITSIIVGVKKQVTPFQQPATSTPSDPAVQLPVSMTGFLDPIRYDPETLEKFRRQGKLPKGTPCSHRKTSISSRHSSGSWHGIVWHQRDTADNGNPAAATSNPPLPTAPMQVTVAATPVSSGLPAPILPLPFPKREKKGLSSSIYAR